MCVCMQVKQVATEAQAQEVSLESGLRIGKSYAVPAIETDASAVRFLLETFMGTRSATPSSTRRVVAIIASILRIRRLFVCCFAAHLPCFAA